MAETMLRGSKIRIYPNKRQTQIIDVWRRRTISLWNLLLSFEQAAYSGENIRPELRWREIWAQVVEERHANAVEAYHHGKRRKDGSFKKEPGVGREAEREALKARLDEMKKRKLQNTPEFNATREALRLIAPKPLPLVPETLIKIRQGKAADPIYHAEPNEDEIGAAQELRREPGLFIWKEEMQALMARLKHVPHTKWIADLPSHAAQRVVNDLIDALNAMLRERRKRASGNGGRDTGFPKFKASRYASGSVYFANTQFSVDVASKSIRDTVKLPNGVGQVRCIWLKWPEKRDDLTALEQTDFEKLQQDKAIKKTAITQADFDRLQRNKTLKKAKLMGGRLWREGEKWFLSCQWEMAKPEPLPETHRQAGVKIGAKILLTTYDERGQTREFDPPPIDERMQRRHKLEGRKLARCLQGQKEKKRKLAARKKNIHGGKVRLRRSGGFFEASARLAKREAKGRNRRDDYLHKLTSGVVQEFGSIAVQKMNIASLMEKESTKKKRRLARIDDAVERNAAGEGQARQRPMKPVRKMMRQAAMARTQQLLKYKYTDLRSPDAHQEIDPHDVNATACSGCGAIHPEWKEMRGIVRCREVLANGSICGTALPRNRNSARLTKRELDVRLKKKERV